MRRPDSRSRWRSRKPSAGEETILPARGTSRVLVGRWVAPLLLACLTFGLAGFAGYEKLVTHKVSSVGKSSASQPQKDNSPTEAEFSHFLALAGVSVSQLMSDHTPMEEASKQEERARQYIAANITLLRECEARISGLSSGTLLALDSSKGGHSKVGQGKALSQRAALMDGVRKAALGEAKVRSPLASQAFQSPEFSQDPLAANPASFDPITAENFAERGLGAPPVSDPR
jgi:hypothetical protein